MNRRDLALKILLIVDNFFYHSRGLHPKKYKNTFSSTSFLVSIPYTFRTLACRQLKPFIAKLITFWNLPEQNLSPVKAFGSKTFLLSKLRSKAFLLSKPIWAKPSSFETYRTKTFLLANLWELNLSLVKAYQSKTFLLSKLMGAKHFSCQTLFPLHKWKNVFENVYFLAYAINWHLLERFFRKLGRIIFVWNASCAFI